MPSPTDSKPEETARSTRNTTTAVGNSTQADSFYGREQFVTKITRSIIHAFKCPVVSSEIRLDHFIAYAMHRTEYPDNIVFAGLMLLHRLRTRYPLDAAVSGHRLFIAAYMLASKFFYDNAYANSSWCTVAQGMFTLSDLSLMERQLCNYLDWDIAVNNETLTAFTAYIDYTFSGPLDEKPVIPFVEYGPPQINTYFQPVPLQALASNYLNYAAHLALPSQVVAVENTVSALAAQSYEPMPRQMMHDPQFVEISTRLRAYNLAPSQQFAGTNWYPHCTYIMPCYIYWCAYAGCVTVPVFYPSYTMYEHPNQTHYH